MTQAILRIERLELRPLGDEHLEHEIRMQYVRSFHLDFDEPIKGSEQGEVEYAIKRTVWTRTSVNHDATSPRFEGMAATHEFRSELTWSGTTAAGYWTYSREHRVSTPPARDGFSASADAPFRGNPELVNPEQLLLAAASSCQLLSYLALAARAGLDVIAYTDAATAEMPVTKDRMRITRITLRPQITLAPGSDLEQARALVGAAHDECYIANTLNAEIVMEARIEVRSVGQR